MLLLTLMLYIAYNIMSIYILKKDPVENGLVYKAVSSVQQWVQAAYTYIQPVQKELITWTLIAVGISVVSLLLMGLPGGLLLILIGKAGIFPSIEGDHTWPAAIFLSVTWPFCLPFGVIAKHALVQQGYISQPNVAWAFSVFIALSVLISLVFGMFGKARGY